MKRRTFLAMPALLAAAPSTDARIDDLRIAFRDFLYRAPYMFGGREVDRVTMLEVTCRLSTRAGKSAEGAYLKLAVVAFLFQLDESVVGGAAAIGNIDVEGGLALIDDVAGLRAVEGGIPMLVAHAIGEEAAGLAAYF